MEARDFRTWSMTATRAQAEDALDSSRILPEQFIAFRNAWLLSAFHYADCYISERARLSSLIAAQATR